MNLENQMAEDVEDHESHDEIDEPGNLLKTCLRQVDSEEDGHNCKARRIEVCFGNH